VYLPATKNFPHNTEIEALLTFTSRNPGMFVRSVSPDAESVTLRQRHSLIKLPDDNFELRVYDPRSNFSSASYQDYATPVEEPLVKRFIARHRLKKKNPEAKISDPVEPIVYYIDRSAPEPIRSALIEGIRWMSGTIWLTGCTARQEAGPTAVGSGILEQGRSLKGMSLLARYESARIF
jgi:hypothetical protein